MPILLPTLTPTAIIKGIRMGTTMVIMIGRGIIDTEPHIITIHMMLGIILTGTPIAGGIIVIM